jgi:hypothetical protein
MGRGIDADIATASAYSTRACARVGERRRRVREVAGDPSPHPSPARGEGGVRVAFIFVFIHVASLDAI